MINPSRNNDQHGSRIGKKIRPAQQSLVPRGRQAKQSKLRHQSRYEELKTSIRAWFEDRFAIAAALKEIRDDKLYKKEYSSFEDFCRDEYGMSRSYAYQLIDVASVATSPKMSSLRTEISNVSQALALKSVPSESRREVVENVIESGARMTAKAIRKSAAKVIDVTPEPSGPKPRVHDCPTCTCRG